MENTQDIRENDGQMMKDYGWFTHYVSDNDFENSPTGINIHTHGFWHTLETPDIQVVLPLPPQIIQTILHSIFDHIKENGILKIGEEYTQFLRGDLPITFAWAKECERNVLRAILPTKEGKIPVKGDEDCSYAVQWEGTLDKISDAMFTQYNVTDGSVEYQV